MEEIVIVSATRSAVGRFLGGLSALSTPQIAAHTIREALRRIDLEPKYIDEVIMGNVLSAGVGQNPARQAAILSAIPSQVGCYTVNKVCGSGLKAIMLGAQAIKAGEAEIILAGGMESMSNAPHIMREGRKVKKYGSINKGELSSLREDFSLIDSMVCDGLWCAFNLCHMGDLAENVASKYQISREEQDEFALASHQQAISAIDDGRFEKEIAPIKVNDTSFCVDECPRRDSNLEKLASLKPVFKGSITATSSITAGNASQLSDGAAALVAMPRKKADEYALKPLAIIEDYASASVDPAWFTVAPASAIRKLLKRTGHKLEDFDLIELNEAFALQSLAVVKELGIDMNKLNVNGGAIALGHPIGCSGARILTTLIYAMQDRKKDLGMAALCIGGGEAIAMSVVRA